MFVVFSDVKTSTDVNFYGAEFTSIEDAGTAHMSVLSPAGNSCVFSILAHKKWSVSLKVLS